MRQKDRIDELEARIGHLEERVDYFVNRVNQHGKRLDAEYYWDRFEDLLAWSQKFDANSEEYKKLTSVGWVMLDKYLDILLLKFVGKEANGK